jgi:glycerol uptake facilitator-like aquaporin
MIKVVKRFRWRQLVVYSTALVIGIMLGVGLCILTTSPKYSPKYDHLAMIPFSFCAGMVFLFEDVLELECGFHFGILTTSIAVSLLLAGVWLSKRRWRNLKLCALGLIVYVILCYLIVLTLQPLLYMYRQSLP